MKTFIQHDLPSLKRIDGDGSRTYLTPSGAKYPSVTSVTGLYSAAGIQKWRNRVGIQEANKITKRASNRGTAIHSLCENYLKIGEVQPELPDQEMFKSLQPYLDKIDNIHCLETQLYSHHLEVAGTVDCIAEYDGKLCVIDFKTSSKPKKREWIDGYFMQTSAYSFMFWELTNIPVGKVLILVGVDDHEPQVFVEHVSSWLDQFRDLRKEYRSVKGI